MHTLLLLRWQCNEVRSGTRFFECILGCVLVEFRRERIFNGSAPMKGARQLGSRFCRQREELVYLPAGTRHYIEEGENSQRCANPETRERTG